MDGVDKPLQLLAGTPLVLHVRERLTPQVGRIVISANTQQAQYAQWGDAVVTDREPGQGPLGGLVSALGAVTTPYAFCCTGDSPQLHPTLVNRLAATLEEQGVDAVYPHDGTRTQPLFLLMRTSVRDGLVQYMQAGGRKVTTWLEQLPLAVHEARDIADSFLNLNTLAELSAASAHFPTRADADPRSPSTVESL
jgi:molybdopterin-guanine dinucleotide biosynthesis protein A